MKKAQPTVTVIRVTDDKNKKCMAVGTCHC